VIRFWLFSYALKLAAPAWESHSRAWLQSAGSTNGEPLIGWGDFKQRGIYRNGVLIVRVLNNDFYTDPVNDLQPLLSLRLGKDR